METRQTLLPLLYYTTLNMQSNVEQRGFDDAEDKSKEGFKDEDCAALRTSSNKEGNDKETTVTNSKRYVQKN